MCTVIILHHVSPHFPVIIAGNRDEDWDRPSEGPQILSTATGAVGGLDAVRGGTWAAVRPDGFFAACTNQRMWGREDPNWVKSRGMLVRNVVEDPSCLNTIIDEGYKPFNLLYGDASSLAVLEFRETGKKVRGEGVPYGIHVLPNDSLDHPDIPKVRRALALLEGIEAMSWADTVHTIHSVLRDHYLPPLTEVPEPPTDVECDIATGQKVQALCVHTPKYGTVSSFLWGIDSSGAKVYYATDGAPCAHSYKDHSHLLTIKRST